MASDPQVSDEQALFLNADRVHEFIESEPDLIVRSLMRLVYGELIIAIAQGRLPDGGTDLLYHFEILRDAFRRKDALENALKGEYGEPDADLEWT